MTFTKDHWFAFGFYLIFMGLVSISSYLFYSYEREEHYKEIDNKLLTVAKGATYLLAPDFHDRAVSADSISPEEDLRNISRFSNIAKMFQVTYIYTMIEKDGDIHFTSSSATDEERRSGENLTRYFDRYGEASETVKNAFVDQKTVFVEESDHWGHFRSVLVPMRSSSGRFYLSGADIRTSIMNQKIEEETLEHLAVVAGVFLLTFPLFLWRFRSIPKE